MANGTPHFFDASRFVSSSGGAEGGTVFFYYTDTTTLAPVYTDIGLTTPANNPVNVGVGAILPVLYLDPTIVYRRRIVFTDGSEFNEDPLPLILGSAILASNSGADLVGYKPNLSGAVTRTVASKLSDITSVKDFGAKGDGSTDDTSAIQAAINSVSGQSAACIYFPPGVYKTTASLTVTRGQLSLKGAGLGSTVIRCATNGVDVFKIRSAVAPNTVSNISISEMQIDTAGFTPTSGTGLYFENVVSASISNVSLGNHSNSLAILGCFNVVIDNCIFAHGGLPTPNGRVAIYVSKSTAPYGGTTCANIFLNNVTGTGGGTYTDSSTPGAGYGMYIDCVDGLWVDNCYFGYYDQAGVYINKAGFFMSGIKLSNVWLDHARNYGLWLNGSSGVNGAAEFNSVRIVGGLNAVYNAYITGNWADVSFNGGHAEQANDHSIACTTTGSGISFTGFDCSAPTTRSSKTCFFFNGPSYVRLSSCTIDGGAAASTLHGAYFGQGVGHVLVGNTMKNCAIAAKIDGVVDYWTAVGNFDATNANTFAINNNSSGSHFFISNVGGQSTGYGTPTGPVKVANFPGASATLVQCSNMIAQLVTELKTRGILAA